MIKKSIVTGVQKAICMIAIMLFFSINVNGQTSSYDPDMDESTWYTYVSGNCQICHARGTCPTCGGGGMMGYNTCLTCQGTGDCLECEGGSTIKKYKDIAIGCKNWRYSSNSKFREAQKAMMRIAYKLSNGHSANPRYIFNYREITDGFVVDFSWGNTIATYNYQYSIYKCPSCHGKKCSNCYNGYVIKNSTIGSCDNIVIRSISYVNGKQVSNGSNGNNYVGPSSPSSGGYNSTRERTPHNCPICEGSGLCASPHTGGYDQYCIGSGICSKCNGSRVLKRVNGDYFECTYCKGSGICGKCGGTGKCNYCHGAGTK